jgi:hypothetical protein
MRKTLVVLVTLALAIVAVLAFAPSSGAQAEEVCVALGEEYQTHILTDVAGGEVAFGEGHIPGTHMGIAGDLFCGFVP